MALHVTNSIVEEKVRSLAAVTGESITEAIGASIDERMARFAQKQVKQRHESVEEILALVRSFDLEPINRDMSEDEILGYGPHGYSE